MTGQQGVAGQVLERAQRLDSTAAVLVEHDGKELWTFHTRGRMPGDQGVTGDENTVVGQHEGTVAGGVPRGVHRNGPPWKIECATGGRQRLGSGDACVGRSAGAEGVHRPRQDTRPPCVHQDPPHADLVEELTPGVRHLGLVQINGRSMDAVEVFGGTDVVIVRVSDEHRRDRFRCMTEFGQRTQKKLPVSGITAVDERDCAAFAQNDPVRVATVDQVNTVGNPDKCGFAHNLHNLV